ncbi:hypothetical protein ACFU6I_39085 [Streptomyces sp. NPDC057486]|uniref:hypothetical protein n=1 Tax=Streptomyces sp. NPDC057486 TaxID=3346145 RepID=UPI0036D202A1
MQAKQPQHLTGPGDVTPRRPDRPDDRMPRPSTCRSCARTAFTLIRPAAEVAFPGLWQPHRPPAAFARVAPISPSATEVPVPAFEAAALIRRPFGEPLSDDLAGPGAVRRGGIDRRR